MGIEENIDDLLDEVTTCSWRLCSVQLTKDSASGLFCSEEHQRQWLSERTKRLPASRLGSTGLWSIGVGDATPATVAAMARRDMPEVWIDQIAAYDHALSRSTLGAQVRELRASRTLYPLLSVWAVRSYSLPASEPSVDGALQRARIGGIIWVGGSSHGRTEALPALSSDTRWMVPRVRPIRALDFYRTEIPHDLGSPSGPDLEVDLYEVRGFIQFADSSTGRSHIPAGEAGSGRSPRTDLATFRVALSTRDTSNAELMDALTIAERAGWRP